MPATSTRPKDIFLDSLFIDFNTNDYLSPSNSSVQPHFLKELSVGASRVRSEGSPPAFTRFTSLLSISSSCIYDTNFLQ